MSDTKTIFVATGNSHKVQEISQILAPLGYDVRSIKELGGMPEVVEDGESFTDNAVKKAVETAKARNVAVIADDSGLEVFALDNAPGIYSARYAGEPTDDTRNLQKLLQKMQGISERRARFRCVIAVANADGTLKGTAEGEVPGQIAEVPAGCGGFGYDPIFIPDGFDLSFAALPPEIKNRLSHRANALQNALRQHLL